MLHLIGMLRAGLIELQGPEDYLLRFFCYASKANAARFTAARLISLSVREKDFSTSYCSRCLALSPSCRLTFVTDAHLEDLVHGNLGDGTKCALLALCLTFLIESLASRHVLHGVAIVKGNCERAYETRVHQDDCRCWRGLRV